MPIALDSGRRPGGARFGRGGARYAQEGAMTCGSLSAGRGSDSRAAMVRCERDGEEAEEGDGEVQSSYKGPFDTMDALQDALPQRRGVSKFYNSKSSSLANAADVVFSSQPENDLANPENPSPRKRKGLLPFGFSWNNPQSKELSPAGGDASNSPMNYRKTLSPAVIDNCLSIRRSDYEHECCNNLPCHCPQRRPNATGIFASPPAPLQRQVISVQMRSVSMDDVQDVTESTTLVSPREKRMKN